YCRSVVLFIYRDPRDVAVSLAHYLASQKHYHILQSYMKKLSPGERLSAVIQGAYPIPIYINRRLNFSGDIRGFMMRYADWLKYPLPNLLCFRFEDLVGEKGGGDSETQVKSIWRMQLGLHVPGKPTDFAGNVFSDKTLTF